jgi:hypothetical protein
MKTNTKHTQFYGVLLAMLILAPAACAFYNPTTGRWLSRDPIGKTGSANLYEFVGQDAVNRLDLLGLVKKKCGVERFKVTWAKGDQPFFELKINITFKTSGEYDARCCEYRQNVHSKFHLTRSDGSVDEIDLPMHEDQFDRRRNEDGSNPDLNKWKDWVPDLSNPNFETSDTPGLLGLQNGWVVDLYEFTAEQVVYSAGKTYKGNPDTGTPSCECEKNPKVAKRGPHTATAKGKVPGPYQYTGIPETLDSD